MSAEAPGQDGQSFRAPQEGIDSDAIDALAHQLGVDREGLASDLEPGESVAPPETSERSFGAPNDIDWTASGAAVETPTPGSDFVIGGEAPQRPLELTAGTREVPEPSPDTPQPAAPPIRKPLSVRGNRIVGGDSERAKPAAGTGGEEPAERPAVNDPWNEVFTPDGRVKGLLGETPAAEAAPSPEDAEPTTPIPAAGERVVGAEAEDAPEPAEVNAAEKAAGEKGWKKGDKIPYDGGEGEIIDFTIDEASDAMFVRIQGVDETVRMPVESLKNGPHYEESAGGEQVARAKKLARKLGNKALAFAKATPKRYKENKTSDIGGFKTEATINEAKFNGMLQTNGEKGSKTAEWMRKGKTKVVMKAMMSGKSEREKVIFGAAPLEKIDDMVAAEVKAAQSLGGSSEATRISAEGARMRASYEETLSRLEELQRNSIDSRAMNRIKAGENGKQRLAEEIQKNKDKLKQLRKDISKLVP